MKIKNLLTLFKHRKNVSQLLESFLIRLNGTVEFGSLTKDETDGIVNWIRELQAQKTNLSVLEVGTLFGMTTRELANRTTAHILTVDNFSWNPFGLDPLTHEAFTRCLLRTSKVEIINSDSVEYLSQATDIDAVFLDGDHRYETVKRELEILKEKGIKYLSGHDWGNESFGVTAAVQDVIGNPDNVIGRCWFKTLL